MNRIRGRVCACAALLGLVALGAPLSAHAQKAGLAPVTAKELVETRGLVGLMLSPDGTHAAFRVDHPDVDKSATILEWRVLRLSDGKSWTIADGGDPRWNNNGFIAPETPQWSPDGVWIYFKRVLKGEAQLWRASRDGKRLGQVTHAAADVQAFIVNTQGRVHYAVGPATRSEIMVAEQQERDSGVLLDHTIIAGYPVSNSFPVNGRMATFRLDEKSPAGRSTLLGAMPLKAFSLDSTFRQATPADPAFVDRFTDLVIDSWGGQRTSDPIRSMRAVDKQSGRWALLDSGPGPLGRSTSRSGTTLRVRAPGAADFVCADPVCTDADHLNIVGWSPAGDELIFQTRAFETVRLNAWDVNTNTVRTVFTTEGVLGSSDSGADGECQIAGAAAICFTSAADSSPKLVSIDLQTGKLQELYDPNPNLIPVRLGVARKLTLHDRYGNAAVGRVLQPRSADGLTPLSGRLPLIMTSYSCRGFLLGGSGREVPEHVLVGLGYTAICIDAGSDVVRRPADFKLTQENGNRSFLDFFEDAVRTLASEGVVDDRRVMLAGFSASATATSFAIAQSDLFTAAAVSTGGSLDPIACYLAAHYRSCESLAKAAGLPLPFDYKSGVMADSPALHVEKIRTPLLMQLPEVEYAEMMQLYSVMLDYGRAVEMYIFPGAYHYKNQPRQKLAVYERNIDWAEFWLRGIERDDARATERDRRWQDMRTSQCRLFADHPAAARPWYCSE